MLKRTPDHILFSNWVAWLAAVAVFVAIAVQMPGFEMLWLPLVAAFGVLALVTFGLNHLLLRVGGLGALVLIIMSTVSFVVAVMQLIIWFRAWPF
jgi:hypothetical protein